ncbi:MAG: hypothetical protein KAG97_07640, partial [Victivallales bacterium]|nr:hypothetical protein [Victivallales bacterium]
IDGRLAFGTSKAIKLVVTKTAGLNQIDDSIFPLRRVSSPLPAKSLYAYSFSSGKYSLEATAENISPSFSVEMSQVVDFRDEELLLRAALSLDVKDAPLKELLVAFPAELAVNRVKGSRVRADEYELVSSGETSKKTKLLRVPLLPDTMGKVDIELFFERNIRGAVSTDIPVVRVEKAKSARGYLLLAASRGLSLTASDTAGLKKVHPGSIPFKIPGLLLSYKFKGWNWSGKVEITHEKTSLVSDTFHLATVGEGAVYGLSFFNYRISGAPTDKLMIVLRKGMNNPEFTGADIVDWRKIKEDDDRQYWQVNFKEKLFGDYKLLATYESPLPSGKKSVSMRFGDVFTENAAAASGFIVIA